MRGAHARRRGPAPAAGVALGSRLRDNGAYTYAVIGDGETDEGLVWKAAMHAGHKKLERLIAFTDYNKMQLDGKITESNALEPLADKWRS
ncbi:1-deoxy-D-xylulose-5-phosphate synthase N-terminal domain-containing protein [Christensenella minuta]|uniref:1-deoxy-D-xylulose-5-phosphate synthase N-terminal domain-containing protein n=1 Tax=Christensenella minuta TaxID=626937 RepID=UPI001A9A6C9D|nr:1-deoxy-D-xylulose-5-phosphate synthase N-terminal domain-containing protein [Christensenella minuta]MDY3751622.1 1-deoxy-D-xylulose-5-phosphate synthase N-terminal domain-containing protein [Christensenella minuta]